MNIGNLAKSPWRKQRKYSNEYLLQRIVDEAKRLGRTPSKSEIRPDATVYRSRFGSYNNAVIAAGLVPNRQIPTSYQNNDRTTISVSQRFRILSRDGFRCQYCGGTPQEGYVLHVDHVVPRSKGGKACDNNLVTACWLCNTGKSNTLVA